MKKKKPKEKKLNEIMEKIFIYTGIEEEIGP